MTAQPRGAARSIVIGVMAATLWATTNAFAGGQATATSASGAAGDPSRVTPQDIYSGLVAETFRGLLQEVVVLGLFIVGIGNMRQGVRDPSYSRTSEFRKRLVLIAAVLLYVTYMKLTYSVEWALGPEDVIRRARTTFTEDERNRSALLVIVLVPIDLAIVVLLAGMFLVLSRDDNLGGQGGILDEVGSLYRLTRATHVFTLGWWFAFAGLAEGGIGRWSDITYHATFVALHSGGLGLLRHSRARLPVGEDSNRVENRHVAIYSVLAVSVYISRIWIYVHRYTS